MLSKTNTARKLYCSKLTDSNPYSPLTVDSDDLHADFMEYEYTHPEKGENSEKVLYAVRIGVPIPSWQTYPITTDTTQLCSDKKKKHLKSTLKQFALGYLFLHGKRMTSTPLNKMKQISTNVFQQYPLEYPSWHGKIIQLLQMTVLRLDKKIQLPI